MTSDQKASSILKLFLSAPATPLQASVCLWVQVRQHWREEKWDTHPSSLVLHILVSFSNLLDTNYLGTSLLVQWLRSCTPNAWGPGFHSWSGNWIPYAATKTWYGTVKGEGNSNPLQYSCLENPQGQRSLAGYSPWGRRFRHDWATFTFFTYILSPQIVGPYILSRFYNCIP